MERQVLHMCDVIFLVRLQFEFDIGWTESVNTDPLQLRVKKYYFAVSESSAVLQLNLTITESMQMSSPVQLRSVSSTIFLLADRVKTRHAQRTRKLHAGTRSRHARTRNETHDHDRTRSHRDMVISHDTTRSDTRRLRHDITRTIATQDDHDTIAIRQDTTRSRHDHDTIAQLVRRVRRSKHEIIATRSRMKRAHTAQVLVETVARVTPRPSGSGATLGGRQQQRRRRILTQAARTFWKRQA